MATVEDRPVVRPAGSFGFQTIASLSEHDPALSFSGREVMGLLVGAQYLYGSFRSRDGRHYSCPVRHFNNDVAISLFVYESSAGEDFVYRRDSNTGHRGIVDVGQQEGMWGYWRPEPQPRCAYLTDESSARWLERGFLDATGRALGSAMQVAVPDLEAPLLYYNRCFQVKEGTVLGREAGGFFFHDVIFLGSNQGWTHTKYLRDLEYAWLAWATEFEDGNIHFGNICYGKEHFSFGFVQRTDGDPIVATRLEAEWELDDQGYPLWVAYELAPGEVWEWRKVEGARAPRSPLAYGPHWAQGVVHRRGEKRRWVHADALQETYAERLLRRRA